MSDRMNQRVPLSQRRGCEISIESENTIGFLLVQAPIQIASPVLTELLGGTLKTNVFGNPYKSYEQRKFAFQYQGHSWTILCSLDILEGHKTYQVSERLKTRCIYLSHEDTSGCSSYALFEQGRYIEKYSWGIDYTEEFLGINPEELPAFAADMEAKGTPLGPGFNPKYWDIYCFHGCRSYKFRSQERTVTEAQVKDSTTCLDMLFRAQDAWLPDWEYLPWSGDIITANSASADDFVRVDIIEFDKNQQRAKFDFEDFMDSVKSRIDNECERFNPDW